MVSIIKVKSFILLIVKSSTSNYSIINNKILVDLDCFIDLLFLVSYDINSKDNVIECIGRIIQLISNISQNSYIKQIISKSGRIIEPTDLLYHFKKHYPSYFNSENIDIRNNISKVENSSMNKSQLNNLSSYYIGSNFVNKGNIKKPFISETFDDLMNS